MHALFQDNNFISSNNVKRKYYQLLIDSFKHDDIKDLSEEKKDIIELFEKSELNNFEEIDKYIVTLVSSPPTSENKKEKNETENRFISELKDPYKRHKSVSNTLLITSLSSSAKSSCKVFCKISLFKSRFRITLAAPAASSALALCS